MEKPINKAVVIYLSPAGTTRHVAEVMYETLIECDVISEIIDLAGKEGRLKTEIDSAGLFQNACIWIGSPVYFGHALPPIIECIKKLPVTMGGYAVPFVTFGRVTSGIALYEMGKMLNEKGYALAGSAKILAVHSGMLQCENPLGQGHPDSSDDEMIKELVKIVAGKMKRGDLGQMPLERIDYQKEAVRQSMLDRSFEAVKKMAPPRKVDLDACTQCGICVEQCPVHCLVCDPFPQFGDDCILCYNCVRLCPEHAIKSNLDVSQAEIMGKKMAEKYAERPLSQIFS